jgi:hypothetical protein
MDKFKKAVHGAIWAGLAAAGSGFVFTGAPTKEQVGQLIGTFIAGAFVGFLGVYRAPANA